MMQIIITNRKTMMVVLCTLMLLAMFFTATGVVSAQEMDAEFMEIMEGIGEDMYDIHKDMHKVVSHLRLISYAGVGIFLVLLAQALIMLKKQ